MSDALAQLAELCGVLPHFYGLDGTEHVTGPESQKALLAANGLDVSDEAAVEETLRTLRMAAEARWFPQEIVVDCGHEAMLEFGLGARWQLIDDETGNVAAEGIAGDRITLPAVEPGVYDLQISVSGRQETVCVLAAPPQTPSLAALTGTSRLWGCNLALYGLRSERGTGLGDFEDLAQAAEILGGQGAGFVGCNPIHDMGFSDRTAVSPYSPSHRGYLNTSLIALDRIPGLEPAAGSLSAQIGERFAAERAADRVGYETHKVKHQAMLDELHAAFRDKGSDRGRREFQNFMEQRDSGLAEFTRFEALSEIHGPDWRAWPENVGEADPDRQAFHGWLQWVADRQVENAQQRAVSGGMALGLYLDLAVGSRRGGAETWCENEAVASGVSLGAPPDHLGPDGQNWQLAAFAPRKLQALRYRPLRRILRQTMRHAGIVRIDHVLGLNRSFWIPDDGAPGAYMRQPFQSLLALVQIEAARCGTVIIGEDLGLVPEGFRDTMRQHGYYGYSVLQFDRDHTGRLKHPADNPSHVLCCFGTHDTPTIRGFEAGNDIDWWHRLGLTDAETVRSQRQVREGDVATLMSFDPASQSISLTDAVHRAIAASPAELVSVQMDDILDCVEAQNLPGTIDEHPNWRRKSAVRLEDLTDDPRLLSLAAVMSNENRGSAAARNGNETDER